MGIIASQKHLNIMLENSKVDAQIVTWRQIN